MDASAQIAVVIISYNTRELLLACLKSVIESAADLSTEIIVVDNASSDGSAAAVRRQYAQARVIENDSNRGFAAACNQAFRASSAPFLLLLNSDARVSREALRALYDCLQGNEKHAAAGCRLIDEQGEEKSNTRNFLTPFNQALELAGASRLFHWSFVSRTYRPRLGNAVQQDCAVEWIDGACLLLKRAALDEIGIFDERFFMYSEDEDLCFRLHQGGWQICFTAAGTAIHIGAASSRRHREAMLEQFYFSQLLFLAKHRGAAVVFLYKQMMRAVLMLKRWTRGSAENQLAFRRACKRSH